MQLSLEVTEAEIVEEKDNVYGDELMIIDCMEIVLRECT